MGRDDTGVLGGGGGGVGGGHSTLVLGDGGVMGSNGGQQ